MTGLVDYGSDDESFPEESGSMGTSVGLEVCQVITTEFGAKRKASDGKVNGKENTGKSSKKLKKLPSLSSAFDVDPLDDPSQHEGRTRSRAFVQGTYYGHLYLTVNIPLKLETVLKELKSDLQSHVGPQYKIHDLFSPSSSLSTSVASSLTPTLNPIQPESTTSDPKLKHRPKRSLHISLSHPLPLRKNQIQDLEDHLRHSIKTWSRHQCDSSQNANASSHSSQPSGIFLSLSSKLSVYENGVATQTRDRVPKEVVYRSSCASETTSRSGSVEQHVLNDLDSTMMTVKPKNGIEGRQDLDDPPLTKETPHLEPGLEHEHTAVFSTSSECPSSNSPLDDVGTTGFGRKGRAFIAFRVVAGHSILDDLQRSILERFLKKHHLPLYHSHPEFHASFLWILLDGEGGSLNHPFTPDQMDQLEQKWGKRIEEAMPSKGWLVEHIEWRVGHRTVRYDL